ncbi:MAG TPA: hypothetical protein VEB60_00500 [Candidatus Paceibacterota bacterium]|nr:hypothetical protein [Candidatus Paceibacterota bacterium]
MTTIIHNRASDAMAAREEREENWVGSLLVGIVLVILAILFFVYALPALQTPAPATNNSVVPSEIDLNIVNPGTDTSGAGTGQTDANPAQ